MANTIRSQYTRAIALLQSQYECHAQVTGLAKSAETALTYSMCTHACIYRLAYHLRKKKLFSSHEAWYVEHYNILSKVKHKTKLGMILFDLK